MRRLWFLSGAESERMAIGTAEHDRLVARRLLAEEIALEAAAPNRAGKDKFLWRLDAFGDDADVLDARDLGERGNEDLCHLIVGEAADIGTVDLEAVDGQGLQVVEAAMTGAEVAERGVEAEPAQRFQAPEDFRHRGGRN